MAPRGAGLRGRRSEWRRASRPGGLAMGRPVWLMAGGGTAAYHWKMIRPRGQATAGDQRINSFGVGGEISVRSGLTVQTQVMSGTPVHFGLGTRTGIDVARIVWPNGNAQAEFGTGVDDVIVAEQRLKGSCPWVFAWDGTRMGFVTDFLWRSPLGLRINAQDTAGVSQTEDWVRIAGDQLRPRDGRLRRPHHRGTLGDALLRSRVAARRRSPG